MSTLSYQERFKTYKGVFDEFTMRNLFELESRGAFEELLSPLKVGKESNVFIAQKGKSKRIVKIYRLQNCDFNRMFYYIRQDPRYEFLKHHRREIIFSWAQREFRNLKYAEEAKVKAPRTYDFKDNILVEEFIGRKEPARPLKDHYPEKPHLFFKFLVLEMKKLYKQGLIHGDLSAFNILNYQEKPYLIDFSQATLVKAHNAEELLLRDVKNVVHFFTKFSLVINEQEIIQTIKK